MKNCLIVLVVLLGCFAVAVFLEFALNMNFGRGFKAGRNGMIASWRDYDDSGLKGLEVSIGPEVIILDVPDKTISKRIQEKGHWNAHAFYCDTHLDVPAEVVVARELKNEDLELDVGHFMPGHSGKIVCVKVFRICEPYPYPTNVAGQTVSYPPPKGLIRTGMLECDLQMLPWHADKIESAPIVMTVDTTTLSDGKRNQNYFPAYENRDADDDELPKVYTYHSDRPDAPKLLVSVYHGKVIQVVGGAEETADIPYRLSPAPAADASQDNDTSWAGWLFDLLFKK